MVNPPMTIVMAFVFSLVIVAIFRYLRSQIRRQEARYGLYRVRDELISLVAADKLDENGKVFNYYYERINSSLESIPVYGLDQALVGYIRFKDSESFRKHLESEKKEAEEILKEVLKLDPSVRAVIVDFYSSNKKMLLAHSSLIRLLYVFLSTSWFPSIPERLICIARHLFFERIIVAIMFLRFADKEESQFRSSM